VSKPDLSSVKAIAFDFDGVFTDDRVLVSETGEESVFCSRSDGLGIGMLRDAGVHMVIISKERNPVVSARAHKLSIEVVQGCDDKLPVLRDWLQRLNIAPKECAFMGNDINDLECMRFVGFAIAPFDAHEAARNVATLITSRCDGRGAIREIAEALVAAKKEL